MQWVRWEPQPPCQQIRPPGPLLASSVQVLVSAWQRPEPEPSELAPGELGPSASLGGISVIQVVAAVVAGVIWASVVLLWRTLQR